MVICGFASLASAWVTPIPETLLGCNSLRDSLMVLSYTCQLIIAANVYITRYLVEIAFLGMLLYLIPVFGIIPLHRLFAELPRALQPGVFFEAVRASAVVSLDWLEMSSRAMLLQGGDPARVLEIQKELYVDSPFGSFLQLSVDIACACLRMP